MHLCVYNFVPTFSQNAASVHLTVGLPKGFLFVQVDFPIYGKLGLNSCPHNPVISLCCPMDGGWLVENVDWFGFYREE